MHPERQESELGVNDKGSRLRVVAWLLVGTIGVSVGVSSPPAVGPKMLQEGGDCLSDEILVWQRPRAERQVAVALDERPDCV